jgi:hypothetical protein
MQFTLKCYALIILELIDMQIVSVLDRTRFGEMMTAGKDRSGYFSLLAVTTADQGTSTLPLALPNPAKLSPTGIPQPASFYK